MKKKIKIFCDTANILLIKKYNKHSLVKGFTTNPSLMKLSGAKNYENYSKKILKICKDKPISFEVFSDDPFNMEQQALKINSWGKNVYVKIPVVNTKGKFMGPLIKKLSKKGIKLNITAVYTIKQVQYILNNIDKSKVIISIFAGRMADAGKDPVPIIKTATKMSIKKKNVEILWASTREAYNHLQAKQLNCHIITTPPAIIDKISNFGKSYEQLTLDTVQAFYKDAKNAKFKL